jgi:hypothetical protein
MELPNIFFFTGNLLLNAVFQGRLHEMPWKPIFSSGELGEEL